MALCKEITYYKKFKLSIKSIFLGGGTPSSLSCKNLKTLFQHLHNTFKISASSEITLECNPENITTEKLLNFSKIGINRLSIGVQSFNEKELKFLGRTHHKNTLHQALTKIKNSPIQNYNIDLIYGLPISTLQNLAQNLESCLSYQPTHISTYCLSIENGTPFEKQNISPLYSDEEAKHYLYILKTLKQAGYQHYETSAFAKAYKQCKHNLAYWQFDNYIGLGPSAHSFIFPYRYHHASNITQYIKNPSPPWTKKNISPINTKDLILEFFCSTLRLKKGFKKTKYEHLFKKKLEQDVHYKLSPLIKKQLLLENKTSIKTSKKGALLLNHLLENLI
eukprot:COSAG01_NODE_2_length_63927_cov_1357.611941_49_plen_335_part_00